MTDPIPTPQRLATIRSLLIRKRSLAAQELRMGPKSQAVLNGIKLPYEEFIDIATLAIMAIDLAQTVFMGPKKSFQEIIAEKEKESVAVKEDLAHAGPISDMTRHFPK